LYELSRTDSTSESQESSRGESSGCENDASRGERLILKDRRLVLGGIIMGATVAMTWLLQQIIGMLGNHLAEEQAKELIV